MEVPSDSVGMVMKTVSGDEIVMRNTKEFDENGQEIKTTEYFLVNQRTATGDNGELMAVEGNDDHQFVAVEVDNTDGIVLDGKEVIIWDELCRICAGSCDQIIPIFSGEGIEHDLYNKIERHLPLKISENDTLPHQICYNCAATLLAWHDLVKNCGDAQQRLLDLQNKLNMKDEFYSEATADEDNVGTTLEVETIFSKEEHDEEEDEEEEENEEMQDSCEEPQQNRCPNLGDSNIIIITTLAAEPDESADDPLSMASSPAAKQPSAEALAKRKTEVALAKCSVNGVTMYQCPECPKRLSTAYNFTAHRRVHAKERTSECSQCHKLFSTSSSLTRHVREVHDKIKDYKCEYCERRLATKVSRDEHQRTHTDERPHVCEVCGKKFRQRASLSVHKRFHSSSVAFRCKLCEKPFRRKQDMQRHELTHTNLTPYGCLVCGKSFRSSASAIRHRQLHESESKYICDLCGDCFLAERLLKLHKKRKHKND